MNLGCKNNKHSKFRIKRVSGNYEIIHGESQKKINKINK